MSVCVNLLPKFLKAKEFKREGLVMVEELPL